MWPLVTASLPLGQHGGFWQVVFGGLVTVNIPKDARFDLDQAIKELGFALTEIVDDE